MDTKIKKIANTLQKIEKDCLGLKRRHDLTEYGKGQLDVIRLILVELESRRYHKFR